MTPAPLRLVPALLLAAVLLTGCEEDIFRPPPLQATYTLWGAFDPTADRQAVRVVPITDTIGVGSPAPLPVTVTSVDLLTGAETTWRDSVVTYSNGSYGHVFLAALRPAYGSRHVFRVVDDEGAETSALVSVPPLIEPIRQTPVVGGGVRYPLLWVDAPRLNRVRVAFQVENERCEVYPSTRTIPPNLVRAVEFGSQVVIPLHEMAEDLLAESIANDPPGFGMRRELSVREITVSVEVASEDWRPPGGVFDPEVLIEPGTLSNVTGGFGFVGASYAQSVSWRPTPDELRRTILRPNQFGCGAGI